MPFPMFRALSDYSSKHSASKRRCFSHTLSYTHTGSLSKDPSTTNLADHLQTCCSLDVWLPLGLSLAVGLDGRLGKVVKETHLDDC
jgi:hypothetical protein